MAKQRKADRASGASRSASAARSAGPGDSTKQSNRRFSFRDYFILNLLFDAFCVLQLLFIRVSVSEVQGLYYFFGLLMAGFLCVSVIDYVYDRLMMDEPMSAGI